MDIQHKVLCEMSTPQQKMQQEPGRLEKTRTEVVSAHLCIEFELSEGVAVAAGSLEEPIADRLIHKVLGSAAANKDDAIGVAFGNGPVLAQPT